MKLRLLWLVTAIVLLMSMGAMAEQITLSVGETRQVELPFTGIWESDAEDVATAGKNGISGVGPGTAVVSCSGMDGQEWSATVTVKESGDEVPQLIRDAIDLALAEWEENYGKTFTQRNKYTRWYCGTGEGCYFGWCGGFASYCLDTAGVPMDEPDKSVPHESGEPYAVFAAGVGKIYKGFNKMNRLTDVPRPGYLVVYGKADYYAYMHIGMITDVTDLGDGLYEIRTVEGNMSNRIKRYCLRYDANAKQEKNLSDTPLDERTGEGIDQYTVHADKWYITGFCQTWVPQTAED